MTWGSVGWKSTDLTLSDRASNFRWRVLADAEGGATRNALNNHLDVEKHRLGGRQRTTQLHAEMEQRTILKRFLDSQRRERCKAECPLLVKPS